MKMTDIWDEKPERHYSSYVMTPHYYAKEMDAWLERLQLHIEHEWQIEENKLRRIIVNQGRRIWSAIALAKRLGPSYQSDRFIEVLGSSEFTTNSEESE